MSDERKGKQVLEVEVERLPADQPWDGASGDGARVGPSDRSSPALGPVLAGALLDGIDLLTQGPMGLRLGFPIGGAAGYFLARGLGLSRRSSLLVGALAGLYCALPGTGRLPLATLVGLWARFARGR